MRFKYLDCQNKKFKTNLNCKVKGVSQNVEQIYQEKKNTGETIRDVRTHPQVKHKRKKNHRKREYRKWKLAKK